MSTGSTFRCDWTYDKTTAFQQKRFVGIEPHCFVCYFAKDDLKWLDEVKGLYCVAYVIIFESISLHILPKYSLLLSSCLNRNISRINA